MAHEPHHPSYQSTSHGPGRQRRRRRPELDITLDAVDDDLVKDLLSIVETQEATKEKLLSQIASCQRQLERLQAVSDAGTLLLEYLGVHIRTSDRRVRHLGEALVKGAGLT